MTVPYRSYYAFTAMGIDEIDDGLVYWCREESKWKCRCPAWVQASRCVHVHWARGQEDVPVAGEYL